MKKGKLVASPSQQTRSEEEEPELIRLVRERIASRRASRAMTEADCRDADKYLAFLAAAGVPVRLADADLKFKVEPGGTGTHSIHH